MLPQNNPDRIRIAFGDNRLIANVGLLLPATLAQHLGPPQLVDRRLSQPRTQLIQSHPGNPIQATPSRQPHPGNPIQAMRRLRN